MNSTTFLNLGYVFNEIYLFFHGIYIFLASDSFSFRLHIFLTVFSIFFIIIILYCSVRMLEIRKKEHAHMHDEIHEYAHAHAKAQEKKHHVVNERWEAVLNYLSSQNPSDWKLAVIESDSMLEDLTDLLEFQGETLGEKLKLVSKDRFKTLDDAWEAHLIRNRIAHEGLKFDLSQREAQRIVALYEKVFIEFGHI